MKKNVHVTLFFLLISISVFSQKPQKFSSNQIYEKVQKLNFLGTALYLAAHPDDENTRLISYLSNQLKARTVYLSFTRGDGGQNLIGPEIRELLGVIRTQELLAARRIDGGEQRFTRANDFGYSKHPDETLEIWNKKKVLSDVVWAIRTLKPDIIINRFNHKTPGTTHGHHTSSAMLSFEAFDLAGRESEFSEQLKHTSVWQPKRLFFNTSSWFYKSQEDFDQATMGKLTSFDVGVFYPLKGVSNNEVASLASSQHLSQGFGRLTRRGSEMEYVEFLKGVKPKDESDLFSGINTTWNRLKSGGEIGDILYEVEETFDFVNPSKHLPDLLKAYSKIQELEDVHWREIKEKQLLEIIEACAGLYFEASASSASATPNSTIELTFEVINRSTLSMRLEAIGFSTNKLLLSKNLELHENVKVNFKETLSIVNQRFTTPYWLNEKASLGMYSVNDQLLIGKPETPRSILVDFHLNMGGQSIKITKDLVYRYAERDKGEIYEPFEILPKVTTKLKDNVLIFSNNIEKKVAVTVKAGAANIHGEVGLKAPEGWQISPNSVPFSITQKGNQKTVDFTVIPPINQAEGKLEAVVVMNGKKFDRELIEINYNHIPKQSVLVKSEAKIVRLDIEKVGDNIGYIEGAGDAIPESLQQIGYRITSINPEEISDENLHKFDAIVLGIRAYNTVAVLKFKQEFLLNYVEKGGNLIVQYNTNRGVDVGAPFQLELSRDRVTDELAKVTFLQENHPLLNFPNKISTKDFDNWVQERGLYFPNKWSKEYTPILSMNDQGEPPRNGSLLIAKYGKGNYIYTGLSFFRELPAGVPGAYKLFANMLSVGKEKSLVKPLIKNE
jgi:LmbE family N-acetylglucosaminyl deacetylase